MKKICSALLAFFALLSASAHSLWIETAPTGQLAQLHEIRIFFGQPEKDKPTPTEKWFSNLREVQVQLISPSGKEIALPALTPTATYYTTSFTPTEEGTYRVRIDHSVRNVHRERRITYLSESFIHVGKSTANRLRMGSPRLQFDLPTQALISGHKYDWRFFENKRSYAKGNVEIVLPSITSDYLELNKKGSCTFAPTEKGKHFVVVTHNDKQAGTHHGTPYKTHITMLTCTLWVE